jgi:hypothetical protein
MFDFDEVRNINILETYFNIYMYVYVYVYVYMYMYI